ncbi:triple gene block 3 protein [Mirabilis jalapa mottle virus]|uniref:Movement protein TGBp3 n=1 Tax=Mirabilis jalapa mottle virus TaxID=1093773 RepID=G5CCW9_9VIRU|nr:triple gene block 3 protein [Mirabilis jalapa mottle virus]AEQ35303.1 triple gene block 3 protein [Mirabilis jalapa mottle virus]
MRTPTLALLVGVLCFCVTLWVMRILDAPTCQLIITGESVRISGCVLNPEHITEMSKLKVLQSCL